MRPAVALWRRSFDTLLLELDVAELSVMNVSFRRVYVNECNL